MIGPGSVISGSSQRSSSSGNRIRRHRVVDGATTSVGRVATTRRRTKRDYAGCLRYLVEERYPDAERICVVQDNLNTHNAGAIYETFPPQQARRISASLEFHYTPKHGSWLNQAEIEISVLERGCLSRPVGDPATLEQRVRALEAERNERQATIDLRFTNR
jgi:hypothetical protein